MNPDSQREAALFQAAAQLAGPARVSFLEQACQADSALRQRLETLLAAHEQSAGVLAEAPDPVKPTLKIEPITEDEAVGQRIGRYKILERVGEGGCGMVYVAEQTEPVRRRVALKVIKLGMDTKAVVARFEAERQALAMMDHPNIAKVLDAGSTETGRPYFVMELVRGIKLTEYCDQSNLPTRDRLDLFIRICHAIQHAHQKGIIHRDIKPSNILVTLHDGVPVPKVIDFGIAKATEGRLSDHTVYTQLHQFIGTPAYMSPEQAEMSGLDIDTRSDIYSLGVLLYELLTGKTPFDGQELISQGVDAMRRTIREKEPAKPSTRLATLKGDELTTTAKRRSIETSKLAKLMRGDLDWIVMKCLEKDRTRRYETANGLAMDIQRHLQNDAVTARSPSSAYRFQKLIRRNKLAFAAAGAVAAALLLGIVISVWQAVRATQAKQEALAARQQAEADEQKAVSAQASEAKLRERAEAQEKKAETEAARSEQVARFMTDMLKGVGPSVSLGRDTKLLREILDQTAQRLNELKKQPEVEADLRQTLGMVYRDLALYTNAQAMLQQALTLRQQTDGEQSLATADTTFQLAELFRLDGRNDDAEAGFRRSLEVRRKLLGNEHPDTAASSFGLAEVLRRERTRLTEAEALHREALSIRERTPGRELDVASSLGGLAIVLKGEAANDKKRSASVLEAEACLRRALEIQRARLGEHPDTSYTMSNLGYLLKSIPGKRDEGETLLREAVAMQRRLFGEHRETAATIHFLASTVTNRAEAEALHREALEMRRKVLGDNHRDTDLSRDALFKLLQGQGRMAEAEAIMRESLGQWHKTEDPSPKSGVFPIRESTDAQPKSSEAPTMTQAEVERLRGKYGNNDPRLASALARLAHTLAAQGKLEDGEPFLREALAIEEKVPEKDKMKLVKTLRSVGSALNRAGRFRESEVFLRPALNLQRAVAGETNAEVPTVANSLGWSLREQRKYGEALAVYRMSAELDDNSVAQMNLASLYETGRGTAKDQAEAAKWYRKAAEQGYAPAQFRLGQRYARGIGVSRDATEALKWWARAGAATNASALNELAWALATSQDAEVRDGARAVVYAEKAVAATGRTTATVVDTLAAAYAEAGQFEKAISAQKEAIGLLKDEKRLRNEGYYARLQLYESNKPYHESSGTTGASGESASPTESGPNETP